MCGYTDDHALQAGLQHHIISLASQIYQHTSKYIGAVISVIALAPHDSYNDYLI